MPLEIAEIIAQRSAFPLAVSVASPKEVSGTMVSNVVGSLDLTYNLGVRYCKFNSQSLFLGYFLGKSLIVGLWASLPDVSKCYNSWGIL